MKDVSNLSRIQLSLPSSVQLIPWSLESKPEQAPTCPLAPITRVDVKVLVVSGIDLFPGATLAPLVILRCLDVSSQAHWCLAVLIEPVRPACALDFLARVVQCVGPVDKDIEVDTKGSFSSRPTGIANTTGPPAEKKSVKCAQRSSCLSFQC